MRRPMHVRRSALALVTVALLAACGSESTTGVPLAASITLGTLPDTLGVGDTLRVAATARSSAGEALPGVLIRWSSSNPSVATVDAITGLLKALSTGDVTVRARSGAAE